MKKLSYLIVLVVILGLVLTGCLLTNVGQVPTSEQSGMSYLMKNGTTTTTPLMAGQTLNVGDVLVWNDGDYLYVKYVITDPDWCLIETHLQVATSLGGIPQTKTGNPKPGQFEENDEHTCVTEVEYKYNLIERGWNLDQNLYIAAHAVVKNLTVTESEIQTYDWGRSTESSDDVSFGGSLGSAVDAGFVLPIDLLQEVWNMNEYQEILGTTTNEFYATWDQWHGIEYETYEVRHFQAFFDIPEEINLDYVDDVKIYSPYYTAEDIIPINDNLYVKLNDNYVGEKGTIYPGSTHGPASSIPYTDGWYSSGSFIAGAGYLIHGQNQLDFVAEEYYWWGGMSKLDVKILWHETETAWANGTGFPGKNWATYFNYILQPAEQLNLLPWGSTDPIETGSGKVMLNNPTGDPNFIVQVDLEGAQTDHTYVVWINAGGVDLSPLVKSPTPGSTWYTLGNLHTNGLGHGSFYIEVNLVYSGILNNIEVALNEVSPFSNRKYSSDLGTIAIN